MTQDLFERTRALFDLPEGVIYLDGNSLGAMPKAARERVRRELDENWSRELIRAWNTAGWIDMPSRIGDRIGALRLAGPRKTILSDSGNFPTDLYIAEGVIGTLDRGYQLKVVAPDEVAEAMDETVAVLMLTEVDYRTGRLHDMAALTAEAKALGIVTIWDLAHSAGALPVDLTGSGADFAVGCGYKYLNGGPGAPAFIYVRPGLQDEVAPVLSGWMGHAAPFEFDLHYRPAPAMHRLRAGTPAVLSMAALEAALTVWEGVEMPAVRARSITLSEAFIRTVEQLCPELQL